MNKNSFQKEEININELIKPYIKRWKWFVLSGILTLSLAYFFLKEIPTLWQILALLPLGAGVVLLTRPVRQPVSLA